MAYVPLVLPEGIDREVRLIVEERVEPLLREVHMLLALRRDNKATGYLAAVSVLMALVSGISMELYEDPEAKNWTGMRFKRLLIKYYPWCKEPSNPDAIVGEDAAELLYNGFRNPLTHNLGYARPKDDHIQKRLQDYTRLVIAKSKLSKAKLEKIERATERPEGWKPTLYKSPDPDGGRDGLKLNLEGFYWGVRQMILATLRDPWAAPAASLVAYASAPSTDPGTVEIP